MRSARVRGRSPIAAIVFGMFPLVGILAIYLVTLAPLRLLRAAPD